METTRPLTFPTVHLNGTSRDELLRQLIDAGHALREALDKLAAASPNGRDYYVNSDPMAFQKARAEHDKRCKGVRTALDEIEQVAEAIAL